MHTDGENRYTIFGRSRQYTVNIDKPSDCELASHVKKVIKEMIKYNPADRISMNEVVARLQDVLAREVLLAVKDSSVWVRVHSIWEEKPSLPEEHLENICYCGVSDGIVAIGGCSTCTVSSVCHHFSVITHSWRRLPDMPTARYFASAAVVGHKLLVFGGRDKHYNKLDVCESFHLKNVVWSSAASMLEYLCCPLVAAAGRKVYIVPHQICNTKMQQYDPNTDSFNWQAELPQHAKTTLYACLVAAADKLYLLGSRQRLALQFSPADNQWTKLQSQPPAMYDFWGCCGVVHYGKILLCGGSREATYCDLVEEFDRTLQQWQATNIKLPFNFQLEIITCCQHLSVDPRPVVNALLL